METDFFDEFRDKISDQDWKRVHYLGRVPYGGFPSIMQVSRVHIYLTYSFVLSWSLLEAMSAGAAIVASDTPPVKEAMVDGETGLFVEFFDQIGLVEKPVSCSMTKRCAKKNWARTHASTSLITTIYYGRVCPNIWNGLTKWPNNPFLVQINLSHNDRFIGDRRRGGFAVREIGLHPLTRAWFRQMRDHCGLLMQYATCGHPMQVH
jgi:hypothetical protein